MFLNMEGTMCVLSLVAVAILPLLGIAEASLDQDDATTMATSTTTITETTYITHTSTLARGAAENISAMSPGTASPSIASAAPQKMASEGKEYILEGCFAQSGTEDIGRMFGQNYTAPEADNMSLSLCLKACASAVGAGSTGSYPFVGVASGDSCYCGTSFNATAPAATLADCTLPCVGNGIEACGGRGYMSVYKTAAPDSASASNISSSTDRSSDPSQTNDANSHGSGATFSENDGMDTSGSESPGVIAGITVGSVSGVVVLLALIFVAAKWCGRRRQLKTATTTSGSSSTSETTSTNPNIHDTASIRDAMRIDLRRLDGVVMDQHSPSPRFAGKNQISVAATTGADWRNSSSPLTPRTPRYVDVLEESQPSTPSIVVHPPEIAPVHGLGERAWHRRRLSAPFPPAGVIHAPGPAVEFGEKDDRRALPSQSSGGISALDSANMAAWRPGQGAISASLEEGTVPSSPSWRWTLSTASDTLEAKVEHDKGEKKA